MSLEINFINFGHHPFREDLQPVSAVKQLPDWYTSLSKYTQNLSTLKGCSPFFDALTSGYMWLTQCDIEFYRNGNRISARVLDKNYEAFVEDRDISHIMPFPEVHGHSMYHFHWWPSWSIKLPDGYSALYTHPLNRYDLPFLTTNGIIDHDKFGVPGRLPFFLREGFEGIIPAGTPFAQVIPFKRDDWEMSVTHLQHDEAVERLMKAEAAYREAGHSGYRKNDWSPKHFA